MAESEWEYEYDENEAEAVYFILDLSTHVPPALPVKKQNRKTPNKSPLATQSANENQASAENGLPDQQEHGQDGDDAATSPSAPHSVRMQIVDLHGSNPLLSYDNNFYSCHWATELGTSMFMTPPATETTDHLPLRSFRSFDLLGTSSARLVAVPASVRPRFGPVDADLHRNHGPSADDEDVMMNTEGDTIRYSATQGLRIDLPANAPANKVSQARFLERFSAIKKRRGENGPVPVKMIRAYNPPEGWEAEREEWIGKETASNVKAAAEAAARLEGLAEQKDTGPRKRKLRGPRVHALRMYKNGRKGMTNMNSELVPADQGDEDIEDEVEELGEGGSQTNTTGKRKRQDGGDGAPVKKKRGRPSASNKPLPKPRRSTGRPVGRPRKIRLDEEEPVVAESSKAAAERAGTDSVTAGQESPVEHANGQPG